MLLSKLPGQRLSYHLKGLLQGMHKWSIKPFLSWYISYCNSYSLQTWRSKVTVKVIRSTRHVFVKHRCPSSNKVKIWQKSLSPTFWVCHSMKEWMTNKYPFTWIFIGPGTGLEKHFLHHKLQVRLEPRGSGPCPQGCGDGDVCHVTQQGQEGACHTVLLTARFYLL